MTLWLPPRIKPNNESAGYLGYYTRVYLGEVFDLMDLDGCWPAIWIYRKRKTRHRRFFEEKPQGQELRDSQRRILRSLAAEPNQSCYVIWDAEKLAQEPPDFPIELTRLGATEDGDDTRSFGREAFDRWLINGWAPVEKALEMPYDPPDDWPPDLDYYNLDRALTNLATSLAGAPDDF